MTDVAGQWYRGSRDTIDTDNQRPKVMGVIEELEAQPAKPVVTSPRRTGKTYADLWNAANLLARRDILGSVQLVIVTDNDGIKATFAEGFQGEEEV